MNLKKFSLVFTLLVLSLLMLSVLSTVSASSIVVTDESSIDNTTNSLILNEYDEEYNCDNADSKSIHSITEDNYYDYFKDAGFIDGNNYTYYNESNLINPNVNVGDTLDLSGVFKNKSFVFDKPLNIISSKGCYLYDCQIAFINIKNSKNPNYTNISSLVSNLTIENHVDGKTAIMSMNSSNIIVSENNIYSTGTSAYPIFLSRGTIDSKVLNNIVKTTIGQGGAWQHPGILLGGSDYNYIAGNDVTVEDSNGIYLSEYSGGISNHNIVFNNTIRSSIHNPSSWAYGINLMGDFNTALNNTVIGTYRGISTSGNNNSIIGNTVYNATGAFYEGSVGESLVGGDYIIYASYNSLVANNSIINSRVAGAAIALCDNSTAYGNNIEITTNNYGIRIFGSNCEIYDNNINFLNGTGIYSAIKLDNLKIFNNTINSVKDIDSFSTVGTGNGVGIYINYQSSSKRPTNVFVSGNDIFTSKKTGIDLSRCDSNTLKYIEDNNLNGALVVLPVGYGENSTNSSTNDTNSSSTNSSIGKTYYVNVNNFNEFFVNGNLASKVNDGDTLIFTGKFSSKGQLNINKRVKIIGKNQNTLAEFVNTTFCISASGVFIDGVKIINSNYNPKNTNEFNTPYNQWGIKIVGANNVTVTNCNISITDKNTSYGIYVFDSIGDTFTYNTIRTEGDYLTYSIVGNEFCNSTIAYNNITTIGTGNLHDYQSSVSYDGEHSVGEMSKTYGIVMVYSSNNNISKNNVYVSSNIKKQPSEFNESTNTLIGIDLYYGSDNNLVKDNKVVIKGKDPFIYGLGVVGALIDEKLPGSYNNSFVNNDVLLNGTYFSSGIIVGNQAIGTLLKNNTLNLYAFNYTYGITLEMSQKSNLIFNKINGNGRANYGIELFSSNNNVFKSNYVYGGGEYAESMGFYGSSNNTIKNNTLISNGTHIYNLSSSSENNFHTDSIKLNTVNSGVFERHGTFSNWISSLNESNYRNSLNFFSNIYNNKDSSNKDFTDLSYKKLSNWFNSLDESTKLEILSLIGKSKGSPLISPNMISDWNQNIYHPEAVDMWNINVWLESNSEGNNFEDNTMVSNNKDSIMADGSSTNNNFNSNGLFYGVSKFMSKYYQNQNSNSNSNNQNSNNQNSNLNSGDVYINGSSQNNGASLDGKSQGMSKIGDINGVSGESSGVSYSACELNSLDKASAAYTIPFIILVLVILFCYGFLRKDEEE